VRSLETTAALTTRPGPNGDRGSLFELRRYGVGPGDCMSVPAQSARLLIHTVFGRASMFISFYNHVHFNIRQNTKVANTSGTESNNCDEDDCNGEP
jgi:hypothetical protein